MTVTVKQVEDAAELGARRAIESYNTAHQQQHRDERTGLRWFVGLIVATFWGVVEFFKRHS